MGLDPLRFLEHVHGHVGWLTAAALVHPAVVLRDPKRRAGLAVGLATGLVTTSFAVGAWLYGPYRAQLKLFIFRDSVTLGLLFERKEHLAFGTLVLAWIGAIAYVARGRSVPPARTSLARVAHRAFCGAALLAILVASLGVIVAVARSF